MSSAIDTTGAGVEELAARLHRLEEDTDNAFAAAESLQDVEAGPAVPSFTFGVTPVVVHDTIIYPDPVVGEMYWLQSSGYVENNSAGAIFMQFVLQYVPNGGGGTAFNIALMGLAAGERKYFWTHIMTCIRAAGGAGTASFGSHVAISVNIGGPAGLMQIVEDSFLNSVGFAGFNFANSPHIQLVLNSVPASASVRAFLETYSVERMGARSG